MKKTGMKKGYDREISKNFFFIMLIAFAAACSNNDSIEIPNSPNCTKEYIPVCCQGKPFPNICYAEHAGAFDCSEGQCEESCIPDPDRICTTEHDPYCCDGEVYSNYCQARANCAKNCEKGNCQ